MTRKDFVLIAKIISEMKERGEYDKADVAHAFADRLHETNPQFDRERFLKACLAEV